MKKYFNWMLMASMVCGLSLGFTSCSDDDDDGYTEQVINLSVDDVLKSRGITVDVHSCIVKLPIQCDGEWAAYLAGQENEWLTINNKSVFHNGNETLELIFDENHTKADRFATLRLVTDNGTITDIKVTQTQLWNGEPVDNNSAQWFGDNGLGRGINYNYMFEGDTAQNHKVKFSPSSMTLLDPIFNWSAITELQAKNGDDGQKLLSQNAYVENHLETVNFDDVMRDSLVHGKDSIGVRFDLEIGFGFVEFEGHGAYTAKESKDAVKMNYLISRSATVYEVFTAPGELAETANRLGGESEVTDEMLDAAYAKIEKKEANYKKTNQQKYKRKKDATPEQLDPDYLEPWQQEALDKEYDNVGTPTYANIFSKSFGRLYFRINRAVQMGDEEKLERLLGQLDSNYGPLFVGRAWFGGAINMRIDVDKDSIDVMGNFTGELAGGVDNIFHIEGSITYQEEAQRYIRNSNALISVYGGNAVETANSLSSHFNSNAATDRNNLLDILQKWGKSLQETKDDNGKSVPSRAAMQSMQLQAIWTLFDDPDVQDAIKKYMLQHHPTLPRFVGYIFDK